MGVLNYTFHPFNDGIKGIWRAREKGREESGKEGKEGRIAVVT